jgi:hypothetical protein
VKNNGLLFPDEGSSGFKINESIYLYGKDLAVAMFFAFSTLFCCKLLIINKLLVEAAGVEPDIGVENAQLIDSEKARIGVIFKSTKSTVRSLYSHFAECPKLPNSTLRRPDLSERAF